MRLIHFASNNHSILEPAINYTKDSLIPQWGDKDDACDCPELNEEETPIIAVKQKRCDKVSAERITLLLLSCLCSPFLLYKDFTSLLIITYTAYRKIEKIIFQSTVSQRYEACLC